MNAVDICNLALAYLGDTATVASIDPPEGSAQAQHCARFYPLALKLMLDSHDWNFITKRVYGAIVGECYFEQWRFVYAVPSDANTVISVLPKVMYPNLWWRSLSFTLWPLQPFLWERNAFRDFHLEMVNGQQCILSNACDAIIRYTSTEVQPGFFSGLFTDALAWKLASMLAGPLLKGDAGAKESKRCLEMHMVVMAQAKEQDSNQQHDAPEVQPSNILARF